MIPDLINCQAITFIILELCGISSAVVIAKIVVVVELKYQQSAHLMHCLIMVLWKPGYPGTPSKI